MSKKIDLSNALYTEIHKCTRCGQCTYGKNEAAYIPLCPVNTLGHFFSHSAGGMMQIARSLYEDKLAYSPSLKEILFRCTTCGVCEANCGIIHDHQEIIAKMRISCIGSG